jgi:16S rRNA (guanine527-N7)-methyltransferase
MSSATGGPARPEPLTAEAFAAAAGVSRETLGRLETYLALLRHWQKAINLVGPATLADPWRRHFWDSAQLLPHIPTRARSLLDVGSGAGFPGLVLAILGAPGVTLVESDGRKAAFLREAARATGAPVDIRAERIERLRAPIAPDAITARGVASLDLLLDRIKLYITPNTVCLFPKGRQADREIAAARRRWRMTVIKIPSATDPSGVILRLEDIRGG